MKNILVLVGAALVSQLVFGQELQAAADDVCACLEEPYAVIEKVLGDIAVAQAHGDYSALMAKQGEMLGVVDAATDCFEELPAKYPDIEKSDELKNQVMAIANEQCPNPAENFNFGK